MTSRRFLDCLKFSAFMCNTVIILTSLMFELLVVFPKIHDFDVYFYINSVLGIFICFNIIGNLLACQVVDTSIRLLTERPAMNSLQHPTWHFCSECSIFVPPRAWHCDYCEICILKRDHHCAFTSCCIGHRNYRYFIMFLFYAAIGCIYTIIYNSLYIWWLHYEIYGNFHTILKLLIPILLFWPFNWNSALLFTYIVNIYLGIVACAFLSVYLKYFLRGATTNEYQKGQFIYDLGSWKRNLEMIFGHSMHLIWLSPFVKSKLPHDGLEWESTTEEIQLMTI